ncbi:hypothetical protein C8D88_1011462 [Lentzea atacamensis]|uniref:Uncharacterized protein n=1 Tax=Lentzea atacamensis TaxID=531938 RepID=A0A316IFN8_9PSEU|nr:hypothetical protein [Lentzea atacamensis]PWK91426.1 hypothetical protein C8D88_1011462 [Lentzea atacamensis]
MRILALVCAFLLISTPSAHAGGWAVTYLDPVPSIQPSVAHTVGYWVLQHGTHPFVGGDLGRTGLRFKSGADERLFVGVPLGQPAHYAVTFTLPAGSYEVFGTQGVFPDHQLGTLTVPGTFLIKPPDKDKVAFGSDGTWPWEEIAPPIKNLVTAPSSLAPAPAAAVVPEEPASEPAPVWLVGLVVAGAAGLFLALRKRLRPAARR